MATGEEWSCKCTFVCYCRSSWKCICTLRGGILQGGTLRGGKNYFFGGAYICSLRGGTLRGGKHYCIDGTYICSLRGGTLRGGNLRCGNLRCGNPLRGSLRGGSAAHGLRRNQTYNQYRIVPNLELLQRLPTKFYIIMVRMLSSSAAHN